MDTESQISQLEQALYRQAESLAGEAIRNAEIARARILAEADARLKLREEREVLTAKSEAERLVKRRIQAAETRRAAEFDRLRWALTEEVLAQVRERLPLVMADEAGYLALMGEFLAMAARELPSGGLVVEVNARDFDLLGAQWTAFSARAAPGRLARLARLEQSVLGGMRVSTEDGRARIDQTFETRLSRLEHEMARVVMERLFANAPDLGLLVHG